MSCLYRSFSLTNGILIRRSFRRNDGKIFSAIPALVGVTAISFQSDRLNSCLRCTVRCEGNDSNKNNKKDNDEEDTWEKFLVTVKKVIDKDSLSWEKIATVSGSKVSFVFYPAFIFP